MLSSSISAAVILASALAFVKYKFVGPSVKSSVSPCTAFTGASALAFVI